MIDLGEKILPNLTRLRHLGLYLIATSLTSDCI